MSTNEAVLTLPGWQGSGPAHWQSRWEALHGDRRVEQHDWWAPKRGDWMARLEEVVLAEPVPVWLVAHSLGCHLVAAWAAHSRHRARVRGALLVAPPDLEREGLPPPLTGWRPPVLEALGLPALLVASEDDPYCALERAAVLAGLWHAEFHPIGAFGHLNADSGLGDWPRGRAMLDALRASPTALG